jgi:hypothetical protein
MYRLSDYVWVYIPAFFLGIIPVLHGFGRAAVQAGQAHGAGPLPEGAAVFVRYDAAHRAEFYAQPAGGAFLIGV